MKPENKLALIIAYYLSRFDKTALDNLGYPSFTAAFKHIGASLDIKPSSIRNMRDEFDPLHNNPRAGWIGRDFQKRRSRVKVVETYGDMDEPGLREVALEILQGHSPEHTEIVDELTALIPDSKADRKPRAAIFAPRGPTGKAAEEYFIRYHAGHALPISGILKDVREHAGGYDFEIQSPDNETIFVEVKGMAGDEGGILFTAKEWDTARKEQDKYFLVIVRTVHDKPTLQIIQDPANKLHAKRNIRTTVQVNWSITHGNLAKLDKGKMTHD